MDQLFEKVVLPPEVRDALRTARTLIVPSKRSELVDLATGTADRPVFDVVYDIGGGRLIKEADVTRCRNGLVVNYPEDYMRRRDPDCMRISDDLPTDKPRYRDVFGAEFAPVRQETLDWLGAQDLIVVPFRAGGPVHGRLSLAIIPANAAFFATALVDLQGFIRLDECETFEPRSIIYVAPPFRHTHYNGKQVVVHNRSTSLHEIFAYNLYPGPSAKKGVFSVLLDIGDQEGWVTTHASSVRVTTPYDNDTVIMHEGASGGGKSEMTEEMHREPDGRIHVGTNVVTGDPYFIPLSESSKLSPITDDMTMVYPAVQNGSGKTVVVDAEDGWFLRTDNLTEYGILPSIEHATIHPDEPLVFFNMQAAPGATCLIWDHSLDSTGKRCPNPRVVIPRRMIQGIVSEPEEVDVRTFGVRMPPCTRDNPSYGIMGMMHLIPPSLAWLWRLIAPRGHKNPSIIESNRDVAKANPFGMVGEGVGSYWPFSTGTKVRAANLLLEQILAAPRTRYVLVPNQHIGAYHVGFSAEWLTREFLARRSGARFRANTLSPARCPLFGYAINEVKIDGQLIRPTLLHPEQQSQVGVEAYDFGAKILMDFFKSELPQFLGDGIDPLGRKIIEACLAGADLNEYLALTPMAP